MTSILEEIKLDAQSETKERRNRRVRATVTIPHITESRYKKELRRKNQAIIASLNNEKRYSNR